MENKCKPEIRFPGYSGDWEKRKLGEMSESFEYGLNASATEYDGKNKYIRITDIDDNTHKFLEDNITSPNIDLSSAENYLVKEGDILFARTGASVGKTYIYDNKDGKVFYAGFLIRARIKSGYDPGFIFQNTLTTKYNEFIKITSQRSGQPGVNAQQYASYSIMVPNNDEQTKIGNFFKQLDDMIALHQKELTTLKQTKQGFLQKMFPKEGESVPEVRFPGFTGDWEECKLGDIGKFKNGMNFDKNAMEHGHPFVNLQDIFGRNIVDNSNLGFAESSENQRKEYNLKKGDILFIRSSVKPEGVGEAALVPKDLKDTTYSGFIIRFRPTIEMDNQFKRFIFGTKSIRKQILSHSTSSANTNINQKALEKIKIKIPLCEEQKEIGGFFRNLDNTIALHQRELDALKETKKAFLQKMFV
ncbi:restriction endonuclease subunit S [Bacillus haynesii]|uniref:restriction endonuclease subunit S n=1 Tax=Bacillus haynesii TaxID=1925021 RepID=UPI002DBE4837|nr:restriction endonuclease subunit S [Bacillus haynesii]MEC1449121.1 restriction endonuclease subunit S [Bacillus haynesii]